jgi:hypothetical protein
LHQDGIVVVRAFDDNGVRLPVARVSVQDGRQFDIDLRDIGPARSLTVTVSAPPNALTSMFSTSLRSMVMLAMSRVKRTRPPLAETTNSSPPALPLKR